MYERYANKITLSAFGCLVIGAVMTGASAYSGVKGYSLGVGWGGFAAALNYGAAAINLTYSNHSNQKAAALRGALAQRELSSGVNTES